MAFVGTALSWIMIHNFGRRTIFLSGITFLAALHYIIGGLAVVSEGGNGNAKWGQAALTIIWVFGEICHLTTVRPSSLCVGYDFTIGPLAYCEWTST